MPLSPESEHLAVRSSVSSAIVWFWCDPNSRIVVAIKSFFFSFSFFFSYKKLLMWSSSRKIKSVKRKSNIKLDTRDHSIFRKGVLMEERATRTKCQQIDDANGKINRDPLLSNFLPFNWLTICIWVCNLHLPSIFSRSLDCIFISSWSHSNRVFLVQ